MGRPEKAESEKSEKNESGKLIDKVSLDNLYNIKKGALTQLTQLLTQAGIKKR